jgi:S-adenosylmethionine uptake transporter
MPVIAALRSNPQLAAITSILTGMLCISVQDTVIKWVSGDYPLHEIVLGRAVVAVFLVLGIMKLEGGFHLLRTKVIKLHLTRGALLVTANMSYFLALAILPIAEAMSIFFVAPLFITALSVPFLGEKVGIRRWAAVTIGLVGVLVVIRPGTGVFEWAALLPIIGAMSYAILQIITRRMGVTERASTMAVYVQLTFIVVSAGFGLVAGDGGFVADGDHPSKQFLLRAWVWPTPVDAALIALCGTMTAGTSYLLAQAYRLAEPTMIAPFEYVALPLVMIWGFVLWGDLPDMISLLGIALIVGGGLFVFYRESIRGSKLVVERPMPRSR